VRPVAVGNGLRGRLMFSQICGHDLFHVWRSRRLLRLTTECQNEWSRQGYRSPRNCPCPLFDFHKHTPWVARRLRKLFLTISYFRFCAPPLRCWCQSP
jgi:hypothetical protein